MASECQSKSWSVSSSPCSVTWVNRKTEGRLSHFVETLPDSTESLNIDLLVNSSLPSPGFFHKCSLQRTLDAVFLQVRIPKELGVRFAEVRILKNLSAGEPDKAGAGSGIEIGIGGGIASAWK